MLVLLLPTLVLQALVGLSRPATRPSARGRTCGRPGPPLMIDYDIDTAEAPDLQTFEAMLRVKPYPREAPYRLDGPAAWAGAEPLQLQPPPSREAQSALRKFYKAQLGSRYGPALEHVCDGGSRLPGETWLGSGAKRTAVLHATESSYYVGCRKFPRLAHTVLQLPDSASAAALGEYRLPFGEASFKTVVSHACLAYAASPLSLFSELHRVLRPEGQLVVTFFGDGSMLDPCAPPRPALDRSPSPLARAAVYRGGGRPGQPSQLVHLPHRQVHLTAAGLRGRAALSCVRSPLRELALA